MAFCAYCKAGRGGADPEEPHKQHCVVGQIDRLKATARQRVYVADVGDGFSVRGQLGGPLAVPGTPGHAIFGVGTESACKARRVIVLGVIDQIIDSAMVCSGCDQPLAEHPPGPPCPPKRGRRPEPQG